MVPCICRLRLCKKQSQKVKVSKLSVLYCFQERLCSSYDVQKPTRLGLRRTEDYQTSKNRHKIAMFVGIIALVAMVPILNSEAAIYNSKTQICCSGSVFQKGNSTGCCGSKPFDATESLCCGDQVFPMEPRPMDNDGSSLLIWQPQGCCLSPSGIAKTFNTRTHECCDGDVLEKPNQKASYGCCSGKLYDAAVHRCCGEHLMDNKDDIECCSDKSYNISTQICCQRWERQGDRVQQEFAVLLDRKGPQSSCCGPNVFDPSREICCGDKMLPKPDNIPINDAICCDGKVVDRQSQLCCKSYINATGAIRAPEGKVFARSTPHTVCCGLGVINYRKEVCCNVNETVIPKPENVDEKFRATCCGDKIMTSFRDQLCINGKLIERNSTDFWSCGDDGKIFNYRTQACCSGEVLEKAGDTSCCYRGSAQQKTFNRKKEICCKGGVQTLTKQDIERGKFDCCE